MPAVIDRFRSTFDRLEPGVDMELPGLYAPDVRFVDPMRTLEGLDALQAHFDGMNAKIVSCAFEWHAVVVGHGEATLTWDMHLVGRLPGQSGTVAGASYLRFSDGPGGRVLEQRDYYDLGVLVYERIPLLGWVIRMIKQSL